MTLLQLSPEAKRAHGATQAWRRGQPTLLLDKGQRAWVKRFDQSKSNAVWCIGRQRGKSFAALAYACEVAMRTPGAIIRYAAKTKDTARQIVTQTLEQLLEWCEEDLRPEIDETHATVRWSNGSLLTWAGTDAQSFDRLRGPRAHLIFLDESAFYQDLEHVEAALLPQLTTTEGKAIYLSTPPESVGHPFAARFRSALASGCAERETIEDNPRLTPAQKDAILRRFAEMHGMTPQDARASTFWRREYLAEFVTEESRAALPGFTPEAAERIVVEWPRPSHRDHYVSLDIGYHDGHGVLFGYWDFKASKLVVEDEIVLRGKTSDVLAEAIKRKERELYGELKYDGTLLAAMDWDKIPDYVAGRIHEKADKQPYLRVSDDNALILADLIQRHGIAFLPTQKHDKAAAVDAVDIAIRREEIVIHPRCVGLRSQAQTTLWDKSRREWERTAEGHGELVDCLVYMWRNVRKSKNPYPEQVDPWARHLVPHNQNSEWQKLRKVR